MAKLTREEFDKRYWQDEGPENVPASTRREFYSDYRESGKSYRDYWEETTSIGKTTRAARLAEAALSKGEREHAAEILLRIPSYAFAEMDKKHPQLSARLNALYAASAKPNPRPAKRKNTRIRRNPDDFGFLADDLIVGQTILKQMGGRGRLVGMIGAKNFISYPHGVGFKFMDPGAGMPNQVKITLNARDTYDLEFGRERGMNYKVIKTFTDIYNDSLRSLFEKTTGLYLSL